MRSGHPRDVARRRAPAVLWLWVLWLLLWGGVRPVPLVGGVLVALGVVALFGPPTVRRPRLRRPLRLLWLIGNLLTELVATSVIVAWEALTRGPKVSTGIVEVPLRTDSELLMASTALLSLMVPGSLVLEMDRERRLLYIHALPLRTRADVERRRDAVAGVERRLGRVFAERGPGDGAVADGGTRSDERTGGGT